MSNIYGKPLQGLRYGKKGWLLINAGLAAGLEGAISKASIRGEKWFGYYWEPTAIVAKYKLQKLDIKALEPKPEQLKCLSSKDCPNPEPARFPKSVTTGKFKDSFFRCHTIQLKMSKVCDGKSLGRFQCFAA